MNRTRWLIVGLLVLLALAVPSLVEACENPPPTCPEGEVMVGTPVWDIVGSHQGECEDDVWTDGIPAVTHEECDTPAIEGHCSVVVSGWFGDSYDMSYAYHRNGNSRNCSMNNEYKHSPDIISLSKNYLSENLGSRNSSIGMSNNYRCRSHGWVLDRRNLRNYQ